MQCSSLSVVGGVSGARSPDPLSAEPMLGHCFCGYPGLSCSRHRPGAPPCLGPVESHMVGAVVSARGEPRMPRQALSCSAESCPCPSC